MGARPKWGRELNRVLVLREQQLQNAAFCKASQMSKVRASSHEYPDVEEI